jgi:hypothetical protein
METSVSSGRTHHLIAGSTTKLNGGKLKRSRWVTNREGHRAIQIAQKIADVIYPHDTKNEGNTKLRSHYFPLFVSPGCLGLTHRPKPNKDGAYTISSLDLSIQDNKGIRQQLQPIMEDCDLLELEQIDPHRAWRSEDKYQVGKPWNLTTHQLRRSLALYAQRSGLVSLPSLRRQLKHITDEMSRYYARGSAYARNFIGDDKQHFGVEWQETQPVSAALSYILHVHCSDDVLFGGHINWLNKQRETGVVSLITRKETFHRFKMGQIAYRETLLGGCTNTGECKQIAVKILDIDCINGCTNLVGKLSNLERIISAQTRLVNTLDPASIEYRTDKADLDILIAARGKAVGQQELNLEVA